jgi:hypothetical protein
LTLTGTERTRETPGKTQDDDAGGAKSGANSGAGKMGEGMIAAAIAAIASLPLEPEEKAALMRRLLADD